MCPLLDILDSAFTRTNGFNGWPRRRRRRWRCDDYCWAGLLLRFDAAGLATGAVDALPISPAIRTPLVSVGVTSSGLRSTSVIDPFDLRESDALRLFGRHQQA